MKKLLMTLVLFITVFTLVGCGAKKGIVGKWEYEGGMYVYTFNEDGTGSYAGRNFTYTIDGDKISILYDGSTMPFESTYKIDGNKLNILDSNGKDTIYNRK